jgi:hypothetical protein
LGCFNRVKEDSDWHLLVNMLISSKLNLKYFHLK